MTHVLDTNVVSALMRGDPRVVDRVNRLARADVAVPEPVFAEIAYGIERLPDSKRKHLLRRQFELLRSELPHAVWSDPVTDAFGTIKARLEKPGRRIEDLDAAVAAHAVAHHAVLVTASVRHMLRLHRQHRAGRDRPRVHECHTPGRHTEVARRDSARP